MEELYGGGDGVQLIDDEQPVREYVLDLPEGVEHRRRPNNHHDDQVDEVLGVAKGDICRSEDHPETDREHDNYRDSEQNAEDLNYGRRPADSYAHREKDDDLGQEVHQCDDRR